MLYAQKLCNKINYESSYVAEKAKILSDKLEASKLDKLRECCICYMSSILILFDCGLHKFCYDCYTKIDKCAVCRSEKK